MTDKKMGLVWREKEEPVGTIKMRDGSVLSKKLYDEFLRRSLAPNPFIAFEPTTEEKSRISKWRRRILDTTKNVLVGLAALSPIALIFLAAATWETVGWAILIGMTVVMGGLLVWIVGYIIRELM